MAKDVKEPRMYTYQGNEYSAEDLDKILEQHEKRKEYRGTTTYDPEKAKAYRERRDEQMKKDPEKYEAFLAARRKYQRMRQTLQKDAMAFAKAREKEFEAFRKAKAA